MILLNGSDIHSLLQGREFDIMDTVRDAYIAHERGHSQLPAAEFLRFPGMERERIIPLPAYLGGPFEVAGIKWIASFPDNVDRGMERASASVLLNSVKTGRPEALLEGSIISAKRTAASAALAAQALATSELDSPIQAASFVGCGFISFQTALFLFAAFPDLNTVHLHDLDASRAHQLGERLQAATDRSLTVNVVQSTKDALDGASLAVFATTAVEPHVASLDGCAAGAIVLHISLRDLVPHLLLDADNIVDDVDHVCQAQTSVHRAEQSVGHRSFIRGTVGELLLESVPAKQHDEKPTIFSPFGLGILDLALAQFTCNIAEKMGVGQKIESFIPRPWTEREEKATHRLPAVPDQEE